MSQQAVERAIGKLITDESFRATFCADPAAASLEAGSRLSATELAGLTSIPDHAPEQFARSVDDRTRRLVSVPAAGVGARS